MTVRALLACVLLLAACGAPEARTLPPPSSTSSTAPSPTASQPDFSRIALEPVSGRTVAAEPETEGAATLRGSVQGPDGPVADAVVRADRLVRGPDGDTVQRSEVRSGPDGAFTIDRIPGGRFRVRAFLPPDLVMESAEIFFLPDGEDRELRLLLQPFTGLTVRASTTPASPIVGQGVNLAVLVAERTVDGDGIAREVPQAGVSVRVSASGWTSSSVGALDDPTTTDGNGVAVFEFRCELVGPVSARAVVGANGQAFPLEPPACRPVPTTTTTTTTTAVDDSTTTTSGPTTTTTGPP